MLFRKPVLTLIIISIVIISVTGTSFAHRMLIEPVEDGKIRVIFDDGTSSSEADVAVYDAEGEKLKEGLVDEEGYFSYEDIPGAASIVSSDSMGHRAEWEIGEEAPESGVNFLRVLVVVFVFGLVSAVFYYKKKKT